MGRWQGSYENIERLWLRWLTASGELILTPSEESIAAKARATQAEELAQRLS
ncbi:MAG: hypothetical protein F6K58_02100 [Symploca sp. SIO2E9]|nr:hypothetical protein [Symploca sp. SIO2E9]